MPTSPIKKKVPMREYFDKVFNEDSGSSSIDLNRQFVRRIQESAKGPSTWWLEGAGGTPQVGGSTPGLGLKNHTRQFHSKHMVKARPYVALAASPCVWVGKAHVPKHKLRTGPWVVLTGNRHLCMGGCGVREIFSACMRRLLLS
jgi:hypothetical protein